MPDFDALVVEREPEVIVDETEFELVIEVQIPAVELRQFAIEILGCTIAIAGGHGDIAFRREFDLPANADTAHVTANLDDGALEVRIPKLPRREPRELGGGTHIPGFHPDATPC